jgi:SAM-dependent methyltransferase
MNDKPRSGSPSVKAAQSLARTSIGGPAKDRTTLEERVHALAAVQPWVHDIELPHGVRTRPDVPDAPHANPVKWRRLSPLFAALALKGKRVLDVGCNEGFYSLQAARHGAKVVGVDIDPERIKKAKFVAQVLGEKNVEYQVADIYSEDFEKLGRFDVTLALGFIHRLPDPYRAVARIVERSDITLFEWQTFRWGPWHDTFAYYTPRRNDPQNYFNPRFWRPSPACLVAVLRDLGYDRFRLIDDGRVVRVMLLAGRTEHPALLPRPGDVRAPPRLKTLLGATREYMGAARNALRGPRPF